MIDTGGRDCAVRMVTTSVTNYLIEHPEHIARTLYPLYTLAASCMTEAQLMTWVTRAAGQPGALIAEGVRA